jgi:hypothetical protein
MIVAARGGHGLRTKETIMPNTILPPRSTALGNMARAAGLAAMAMLPGAPLATAEPIVQTFNFSATNFSNILGSDPAPVDPVTGSITVSWDNANFYTNETVGLVVNSLNIQIDAVGFNYRPATATSNPDHLQIGGLIGGIGGINLNTYDFSIEFVNASSTSPAALGLGYVQNGSSFWGTNQATVTVSSDNNVFEPSSLGLFASAAVGLLALRRRAVSVGSHKTGIRYG